VFEFDSVFHEVAVVLFGAVAIGVLARKLGQPLIVAFIFVGIAVGPMGLDIIGDSETIGVMADIGIALLLFLVGLKLDFHLIRVVGPVALAAGLGQVAFTSAIGFGIALLLGFAPVTALYIAIALTFSSTIIIVKLLSDKDELEAPHGRVAMGILIVQDVVVVLVMILVTAFGSADEEAGSPLPVELGYTALRGVVFIGAIWALMRWVLPRLLHRLSGTAELMVLFAAAWAVALAALGDALGFSEEVGAFLAGVSIAQTSFRDAIGSRLTSLRDFLLLFFFIDLGADLDLGTAGEDILAAGVLSLFVLVGNPIIVMAIMGAMRYRSDVSFRTGLTVAQISEFSLIFAALGLSMGHIGEDTLGLITTVGLATITLSTYLILNSGALHRRLAPALRIFERSQPKEADFDLGTDEPPPEVIVLGLGRLGLQVLAKLHEAGITSLGVDLDPASLQLAEEQGLRVTYGDAADQDLFGHLPVAELRAVVCSVTDLDSARAAVAAVRSAAPEVEVWVGVHDDAERRALAAHDIDHIIEPFADAAEGVVREALARRAPAGSDDGSTQDVDAGSAREAAAATRPAAPR
jgi:Kef-type K+ transport system membrane component KefB